MLPHKSFQTTGTRGPLMNARFFISAMAYGVMLFLTYGYIGRDDLTIFDALVWLGYLLAVALVALWPSSNKANRAELDSPTGNWADRIDFEKKA